MQEQTSSIYGTPLHCAARFSRIAAAELLLRRAPNPNRQGPAEIDGDSKWTPLVCAVFKNDSPTADLLLKHGADPRLASRKGIGTVACATAHEHVELVRLFLQASAPATSHALFCGVEKANVEI